MSKSQNNNDAFASEIIKRLNGIDDEQLRLEAERADLVQKALTSSNPSDMLRASRELGALNRNDDQKSYTFDTSSLVTANDYLERPYKINTDTLRRMARTPMIKSIIGTRLSQVLEFSQVSNDPHKRGWRIFKKRRMFEEEKDLTKYEERRIEDLTNFLINAGTDTNKWRADSFSSFLSKQTKDSLEIDQAAFEIVRNRRGNVITEFLSTDGGTFRYAVPVYDPKSDPRKMVNGMYPNIVQLYENRPYAYFYEWELSLGMRNKDTDVRGYGYSVAELEDLINIVTWALNSDQYNGNMFSKGSMPKGMFRLSGNVNKKSLQDFKSFWQSQVLGVHNAWRTPFIEADKMEYFDLQKTNMEMQYQQWVEYLVRIACAVFKIDPTEIGFMQTNGGGGDVVTSHKQKTDYSKDKGLYPLLKFHEDRINKWLISEIDDGYRFEFTGVHPENEVDRAELLVKKMQYTPINKILKQEGYDPIDGADDVILNSTYIQWLQMNMMGGQESNDYMDSEEGGGGGYEDNPFAQYGDEDEGDDDTIKANRAIKMIDAGSPIWNELGDWIKRGMPRELKADPSKL